MSLTKTTVKAVLIDLTNEQKALLDHMMLVFCTAIRYSFKRQLEGQRIGDLEKVVAHKYHLNIRQAKDAVESARQTIASQHELVRLHHQNYSKKVEALVKKLKKPKLSERRVKALTAKLAKRQQKLDYWTTFLTSKTIPPVTFGTKKMFLRRCKGLISKQEWNDCRNNRFYSRGDKTKGGNPNLRVVFKDRVSFLEISTLEKTVKNRAIKVMMPIYLPQKLSKKTGKVNGVHYRKLFMESLEQGVAYQVELIKQDGKYYAHITFEEPEANVVDTGHLNMIGADTNPDGFVLTRIDNKGNYRGHTYLKQHELTFCRSNRRTNLCGELVKQAVEAAKTNHCGIAAEDLKFKDDRDVTGKMARVSSQFVYATLLQMLERSCLRNGVEFVKVRPQYTSKIGLYKYCHQYGLDVHNGAALVIARRSYGLKETVPKLLRDKLVPKKTLTIFNQRNEWGQWSEISKQVDRLFKKRKEVNTPGLWLVRRKELLRIA
ncbi:IS200/IS605 family accessory protein TnpB-related protein [Desulfosporosinus lacus]|uniref:Transposase, IS605 OrfB family, central region n=1 Tax=Desulfosporosinus lacus DSM 15449 TaxID=1121420 RepID=A0A1M5SGT0_9FIRM|nr:IS200/IS605 family accessory protein TnpB-related protein [Desulfosporosinus lacus]SHH37691.1 transposase, IS605 OrfB family, central region [Desulfosporosinus lacus DSM 15449]